MAEKRTSFTIRLVSDLHEALRLKARVSGCSISAIVEDAVQAVLAEDDHDLAAFADRASDPEISYPKLRYVLRSEGKL